MCVQKKKKSLNFEWLEWSSWPIAADHFFTHQNVETKIGEYQERMNVSQSVDFASIASQQDGLQSYLDC